MTTFRIRTRIAPAAWRQPTNTHAIGLANQSNCNANHLSSVLVERSRLNETGDARRGALGMSFARCVPVVDISTFYDRANGMPIASTFLPLVRRHEN